MGDNPFGFLETKSRFEKELKSDKSEFKEQKGEWKENKDETKELKDEKLEQEKLLKNEAKELKDEKEFRAEKPEPEGRPIPFPEELPIAREELLRHAEALEQAARELRHFIEQGERPDLRRGALHNEPDRAGDG